MSLRSSESRLPVSTVSISTAVLLYLAFQVNDTVTGRTPDLTVICLTFKLWVMCENVEFRHDGLMQGGANKERPKTKNMNAQDERKGSRRGGEERWAVKMIGKLIRI